MAIKDHIETLRAKPEHVRRRIAFWSAFGFSALVFMFWISSFKSLSITATAAQPTVAAVTADKAPSPGSSLVAGVGNLGKDIWELIFGAKKVEYSEVQVLPGSN